MILIGLCAIAAGIFTVVKRAPLSRRYIEQNKRRYGETGGLAVQGGMASPGFFGFVGVGMTIIGVGQILVAVVSAR